MTFGQSEEDAAIPSGIRLLSLTELGLESPETDLGKRLGASLRLPLSTVLILPDRSAKSKQKITFKSKQSDRKQRKKCSDLR